MKIKHEIPIIDSDNPFSKCVLGREVYAEALTGIVEKYADGFVLALNNKWGTGKTTFVKMWEQQLRNLGFKTLYFNAWENDFEVDPMVSLVAEMKSISGGNGKWFNSVVKKGAVMLKHTAPHLIKAVANKFIDSDQVVNAIESATKGAAEILKDEIKNFVEKKKGLSDFKGALSQFAEKAGEGKPIVFIIDELDRCRPNYSVELLEQVKHFFSVPGIVFVLSIDKEQLGYAIKGVYGSEQLDANEYLRRFIDLEYVLPEPPKKVFTEYLYRYFGFKDFFVVRKHPELRDDEDSFLTISRYFLDQPGISLRQQEKVLAHARIALLSIDMDHYMFPTAFFFLVYLRVLHPALYKLIVSYSLSPDELLAKISPIFPGNIDSFYLSHFIYLEALCVFLYVNSLDTQTQIKVFLKDPATGDYRLDVQSRLDSSDDSKVFQNMIKQFRHSHWSNFKLNYLTEKVDLTSVVC